MRVRWAAAAALIGVLGACQSGGDTDSTATSTTSAAVPTVAADADCIEVSEQLAGSFRSALVRTGSDLTIDEAVAVPLEQHREPLAYAVGLAFDDGSTAVLGVESPEQSLRVASVDDRANEVFQYGEALGDDDPLIVAAAAIADTDAPERAVGCLG